MPALDFTGFPSKPAAPPAVSAGAPRPTARAGAPAGGPKTGSKTGSANAANGEFGSLVDRLADTPDEGQASSRGVMARGSRGAGVIGEESAAEPRAKGDADEASGATNDASAANTSMASNPAPFPWTLPLSPSLFLIEQVKTPENNGGGDTYHGEGEGDGDGVMSAITAAVGAAAGAIADGAANACLATLPGAAADAGADAGAESATSTTLTVPVDAPIAIDPALTIGAASTASTTSANGAQGAADASAIDASEAFNAAWANATASANAVEAAAGANTSTNTNATTAGDDLLANAGVTSSQFDSSELIADESTIDQSAIAALANARTNSANSANSATASSSSITSNDSTLLAPSATDSATTAAAVDHAAATTAAGQSDQANAAPEAPAPGDQAREQALIELQRAFDAARASASSEAAKPRVRNPEAPIVLHTDPLNAATNDATASANGAAHQSALEAVANAGTGSNGAGSNGTGTLTGAAGADSAIASTSASGRTSRSRDSQETSEEIDTDSELTAASSWAAAAAAKYAEAAGAGTSGGDTLDSGSNADAAANTGLAGRAGDAAGNASSVAFDARVVGASRANEHSAIANGSAGESAIVTTAAPEEQAAQIVKSMRLQWRGANGEATLRLQPDHLGPVFVSVRVEQGTVSATVRAETAAAQQWIQQHQQQLRDALDAQGLRVTQFHVTHNPDDRPRRETEQDQQQDASGRRSSRSRARRADEDRRFEILL